MPTVPDQIALHDSLLSLATLVCTDYTHQFTHYMYMKVLEVNWGQMYECHDVDECVCECPYVCVCL